MGLIEDFIFALQIKTHIIQYIKRYNIQSEELNSKKLTFSKLVVFLHFR
ncbi:hypothetical protein HMPREF0208_01773 [Citrobacter koseri]|nr:hypothetical protein HMPREF3220_03761 [Citrobacter koseri]KXA00882.1 hypothetical protein HMPREF3207_03069 [Citrobacter koseri]KXB44677.1 hypothetical protein HMPREF0208_01773 [Citrobacter koseri]